MDSIQHGTFKQIESNIFLEAPSLIYANLSFQQEESHSEIHSHHKNLALLNEFLIYRDPERALEATYFYPRKDDSDLSDAVS